MGFMQFQTLLLRYSNLFCDNLNYALNAVIGNSGI
jgi:hypothetical protein